MKKEGRKKQKKKKLGFWMDSGKIGENDILIIVF